jgi:glutaminyl-peptide cyclotransferase
MHRLIGRVFIALMLLVAGTTLAQLPSPAATEEAIPETTAEPEPVALLVPEVIEMYPHDTGSYTQGLLYYDGALYESAGQEGESDVRRVDPVSGDILQKVELDAIIFAEGLALVDERLIQLTWQNNAAFVYDRETFDLQETFSYDGQGWGLCYDGEQLWMSDGTDRLMTRDPETFEYTGELNVMIENYRLSEVRTSDNRTISQLNELECVGDTIYANVYMTDFILQIDRATGMVTALIYAGGLLTPEESAELKYGWVLNGIAYDAEEEVFYLTGKYWPKLFKVRFVEFESEPSN